MNDRDDNRHLLVRLTAISHALVGLEVIASEMSAAVARIADALDRANENSPIDAINRLMHEDAPFGDEPMSEPTSPLPDDQAWRLR